jgi:hypothetical protein
VRRIGLKHTALARACANTIRLRLLKIGAVVTISVRRVKLAMSEACPHQREFIRPTRVDYIIANEDHVFANSEDDLVVVIGRVVDEIARVNQSLFTEGQVRAAVGRWLVKTTPK